jgi:hypothetical protein
LRFPSFSMFSMTPAGLHDGFDAIPPTHALNHNTLLSTDGHYETPGNNSSLREVCLSLVPSIRQISTIG